MSSKDAPCIKGLSDNACDAPWCDCCNADYAHLRNFIIEHAVGQDATDVALGALDRLINKEE
jgi:hypothetical protein